MNPGSSEKDPRGHASTTRHEVDGPRPPASASEEQTVLRPPSEEQTSIDLTQQALTPDDFDSERTRFVGAPDGASSAESGATRLTPPPGPRAEGAAPRTPAASGNALTSAAPDTVVPGGPDEGPLAAGHPFGSRYEIIAVMGVGGMGAVYKAWDKELGVLVALKVIRAEVAADPETARALEKRFKQELLLARQVTHRNVVRIHDLGEVRGIKYITMPLVEGEDLSAILKREGSLSVTRVMPIARTMVSGLVAAHKAGVVHRDLKPANIMVDAHGEALIMDFGIARSTVRVDGPAAAAAGLPAAVRLAEISGHTVAGSVVGTIDYMAPEQARAQPVDQRADIYAVGLILYDLLLGRKRSEHADSAVLELQLRMQNAPPQPRKVNPQIPETLDAVIMRCLQPDPAARFQTSEELLAALNRLDDDGFPLPVMRRLTRRMVAAVAVITLSLIAGAFYAARWISAPETQHEPVSMVIADFQNGTKDPAFDRTLEQVLKRALEDARFISAYDRNGLRGALGISPPATLDETAARTLAVKQGLGLVVSGSITSQEGQYEITVKATEAVSGKTVISTMTRVSSKEEVLGAATQLVARVRKALGDETSDSARLFARSVSATSPDVIREYAAAIEAQSNGKADESRQHLLKAVALDPQFGIGYQSLAVVARNAGKLDDANKYIKEALRHLDGMTERERLGTRGFYYQLTGDYRQCEKEYAELIARSSANYVAHNQRALCLSNLRDMRGAVEEVRQAVQILPNRVLYRANLALYSAYAGDFEGAQREAEAIKSPNDLTILAIAYAHAGRGRVQDAQSMYEILATMGPRGASWAESGLGDLALYEGRFSDASKIFEKGAAANLAANNPDKAARKLTSAAYAYLTLGQTARAKATAEQALAQSKNPAVRFLAARTLVEVGDISRVRDVAAELSAALAAESQAYGQILQGEIALKAGDPRQAIKILTDANNVLDTWIGRFDLGRAYFEAKAFPQADSEIDACIKRRGEALAFLTDDEPTSGYFPPAYYYQGRIRESMNDAGHTDSYNAYLKIRGRSPEDRLVPEVRRRVAQ